MLALLWVSFAFASGPEFFNPPHDSILPSDFGPVAIESSRRQVLAKIQDWKDDQEEIGSRRAVACAMSGLFDVGMLSVPSVALLTRLPVFMGHGPGQLAPSAPLRGPLTVLARLISFTPGEREALDRLMSTEVQDRSDQLRLFIDVQWFLMRVSNRLYEERIDYHLRRTEGVLGFFRADSEFCYAYTYRAERNRELTKAAERILAYYYFLERELQD